jgi:hypothetical protein
MMILGSVRINGKGHLYKMKMISLWCQALYIYICSMQRNAQNAECHVHIPARRQPRLNSGLL